MTNTDDNHTGIPTRAIHEAYLDMQRALKRYRQARDAGSQAAVDDAHGDVQETVLTLYELLRPHIKNNDAVRGYWDGELPTYNGDGPPDPEEGKGVIQVQDHRDALDWSDVPIDDPETVESMTSLREWHEALGLNGSVRLVGVAPSEAGLFVTQQRYQIGLRQLDDWMTEHTTTQTTLGGFMGSTTRERTTRQRVQVNKLKRAARELGDIIERLGLHSATDVDALPVDEL